jgi:hypothetical protein
MVSLGIRMQDMDVSKIEYHLEFYNANGEQLEHFGNTANALIPPRKGERVILGTRKLALDVISRVHPDRTAWIGVNWFTAGAIIIAAAVFWQRSGNCDRTE